MILYKKRFDIIDKIASLKRNHKTIGFVPTMGALHNGHISLVHKAKELVDIVICSIFVNPTQFNNPQDFEKYPITVKEDIELLEGNGCDIIFMPSVLEMYPNGTQQLKKYELGFIETVYDGAFRPGHFQGVCNVVEKLFQIITPDFAFFGLKDYQQCMVIKKLVELMNWQEKIQLIFCETLREPNGLAMSSRNKRLSIDQKEKAGIIYSVLNQIKNTLTQQNEKEVLNNAYKIIEQAGLQPEYIDIADAFTLKPITEWDGNQKLVCLVAVYSNDVRLIDNMRLN